MIQVIFCLLPKASATPSVLLIRSQLFWLVLRPFAIWIFCIYTYQLFSTSYLQTQEILVSTYKDHAYFSCYSPTDSFLCLWNALVPPKRFILLSNWLVDAERKQKNQSPLILVSDPSIKSLVWCKNQHIAVHSEDVMQKERITQGIKRALTLMTVWLF